MGGLKWTYHPEFVEGALPSQIALGSYGMLHKAQRGAYPLTTIDSAIRFKETSLRNTLQRSWDVHRGSSHAGEGLLVVCGVGKLCFRSQAQPSL